MTPLERSTLYGVFADIRQLTSMLLKEYEQVSNDLNLRKTQPFITAAYLQSIIVNLGKILSKPKNKRNEPFRLESFKLLGYQNVNSRIEAIELSYADLIEKIRNNRDKIFAHTDEDFHKMLFSPAYVAQMEKTYGRKYPELIANDSNTERYTAVDLTNDIPKLRELLDALDGVWLEASTSDPQYKN